MAILSADVVFSNKEINRLIKVFPDLNGRLLALFGKRARTVLKKEFLSGQEITLNKFPKNSRGAYTITSDVNKKRTFVKIYSPPVNLFEQGRLLRSGKKEAGKFIITKKLKQVILSRQGTYIREFEGKVLQKEIKKAGL
jgi:hypothetical protein